MFFKSLVTCSSLAAVASFALSLSAVACSSATSAEPTASSSGQAVSSTPVDPAFTPCAFDTDCVAVAQAGCCHNGWLAAVNADLVCAYNEENACTTQGSICPQYVVVDTRVAICGCSSDACEMIAPTSIRCGGDGLNPHACPSSYDCVPAPDDTGDASLGTCTPHVAPPADDAGTTTSN